MLLGANRRHNQVSGSAYNFWKHGMELLKNKLQTKLRVLHVCLIMMIVFIALKSLGIDTKGLQREKGALQLLTFLELRLMAMWVKPVS